MESNTTEHIYMIAMVSTMFNADGKVAIQNNEINGVYTTPSGLVIKSTIKKRLDYPTKESYHKATLFIEVIKEGISLGKFSLKLNACDRAFDEVQFNDLSVDNKIQCVIENKPQQLSKIRAHLIFREKLSEKDCRELMHEALRASLSLSIISSRQDSFFGESSAVIRH